MITEDVKDLFVFCLVPNGDGRRESPLGVEFRSGVIPLQSVVHADQFLTFDQVFTAVANGREASAVQDLRGKSLNDFDNL